MLNHSSKTLTKINLLPLHQEAFDGGYQAGKYTQLYNSRFNPPAADDIAQADTRRLQRMPARTQVKRSTNKYDLRVIALPHTLDKLIKSFQCVNKKLPNEIRLNPGTLDLLRQAGFVRDHRFRGMVAVTSDKDVDAYSIYLDRYDFAI